jgi:hypothetical protein
MVLGPGTLGPIAGPAQHDQGATLRPTSTHSVRMVSSQVGSAVSFPLPAWTPVTMLSPMCSHDRGSPAILGGWRAWSGHALALEYEPPVLWASGLIAQGATLKAWPSSHGRNPPW